MSLFAGLLPKSKKAESVIVIDIGAESIAGAYVRYVDGELPAILYTRRMPVEFHKGELEEQAMLRALKILGDTLVSEGAPVLSRSTGSGTANTIVVSVDAPWQKTSVRSEQLEQDEPFVFTKALVSAKVHQTSAEAKGKMLVDESVIGTILNGYETSEPYGKKAQRAEIVILTSLIDEHIATTITSTLQSIYHTKGIQPIAGTSLRCQAMYAAFPHEHDVLILDASGALTSIALLRKGLFVSIVDVPSAKTADAWVKNVGAALAELAGRYPLPRTIFLLARDTDVAELRETLDKAKLESLWLSDDPPKMVSVLASHVAGLVKQVTTAAPDLQLILMALYYAHRDSGAFTEEL